MHSSLVKRTRGKPPSWRLASTVETTVVKKSQQRKNQPKRQKKVTYSKLFCFFLETIANAFSNMFVWFLIEDLQGTQEDTNHEALLSPLILFDIKSLWNFIFFFFGNECKKTQMSIFLFFEEIVEFHFFVEDMKSHFCGRRKARRHKWRFFFLRDCEIYFFFFFFLCVCV